MRRKLIAFLLAMLMCVSLVPSAMAAETVPKPEVLERFEDVPDDAWYMRYLEVAVKAGIVCGTTPTTFSPDDYVTRAQFVTLLGRAVGASPETLDLGYTDIDLESWYAPYIGWASSKGYMDGWSVKEYAPYQPISIEQMACVLDNYVSKTGVEILDFSPVLTCADSDRVSTYAKSSVERMLWYGFLLVDENDNLNPQRWATRADAVASLVKMLEAIESSVSIVKAGDDKVDLSEPKPSFDPEPVKAPMTYADLLPKHYEPILTHDVDDLEAIDNNVRYMFQEGLTELELDIIVDDLSDERFGYELFYWQVMHNYPEFGYKFVRSEATADGLTIIIYGLPRDYVELTKYQDEALALACQIRDGLYESGELREDMTEKEKAEVYFYWCVDNCDYDWDSFYGLKETSFAWMAYGVVHEGLATCQGYTAGYNLFLRLEGIECWTSWTSYHIWSVAILDGETYHIDATWSDMCQTDAEPYFAMPDDTLVKGYEY